MAELITVNGTVTQVTPEDGKVFTLKEWHRYLGHDTTVEHVPLPKEGKIMMCDEDARYTQLPVNKVATDRMKANYGTQHVVHILGDVLICTLQEAGY